MIPKTERHPETSANKAKTKSLTRLPTAEKNAKEGDCTQISVAKKERTDHKYLWQRKKDKTTNAGGKRKMAALIRKWPIQLTPNERNKTAETTSKPQTVAYLQA